MKGRQWLSRRAGKIHQTSADVKHVFDNNQQSKVHDLYSKHYNFFQMSGSFPTSHTFSGKQDKESTAILVIVILTVCAAVL